MFELETKNPAVPLVNCKKYVSYSTPIFFYRELKRQRDLVLKKQRDS